MERTVVYGLGQILNLNRDRILKRYNVVAYCDKDFKKVRQYENGITREYLQEHINDYDIVLITAVPITIVYDLVENLAVPQEKIRILAYDDMRYDRSECVFYGQHLEDAVLMLLLNKINLPISDVRYVDIGANDPVRINNTYNLYLNGARGVLVDPLPGLRILAQMVRPEDKVFIAAVTDFAASETAAFFEYQIPALSSMNKEFCKNLENDKVQERLVCVLGINDILQNLNFTPDVLLIDAEGEDEKIVRAIDYEKYHPTIIVVEFDTCGSAGESLITFMKSKGYCWYTTIKNTNAVFVSAEIYMLKQ